MQVLTQCENLFVIRDCGDSSSGDAKRIDHQSCVVSGSPIESPSQVLPVPNATTVYDRWLRWTALNSEGSGRSVDKLRELQTALDAVPWKTVVLSKDNLLLNMCMVCWQERNIINAPEESPVGEMTLIDFRCACHSAVLTTKPLIKSTGCSTIMVKLGHIFESARTHTRYLEALESEVKACFQYCYAARLPAAAAGWRRQWQSLLDMSVAVQDLQGSDIEFILNAMTCDPDSEDIFHHCTPACALGCGNDQAIALSACQKAVRLVCGGPYQTPLEYRWKGMEVAAAFCRRALQAHKLLLRGLQIVFSKKEVQTASEELQRNREAGDDDGALSRAKHTVNGGKVVTFFESGGAATRLDQCILLNRPLQHYLNAAFQSDTLTERVVRAINMSPPDSDGPPQSLGTRITEAIKANVDILSGVRGEEVVRAYANLLASFASAAWGDIRMDDDQRYECAGHVLVGIAGAWFRLVFLYAEDPRYQLLKLAEDSCFNDRSVRSVTDPISERASKCSKCIDAVFTKVWLRRLTHARRQVRVFAHRYLRHMLATCKLVSTKSERRHLLGQESRSKKRGRSLDATGVSKMTYQKGVIQSASAMYNDVLNEAFGSKCIARRWSQMLPAFEVNRARAAGRSQKSGLKKIPGLKTSIVSGEGKGQGARKVRAYDVFVSERYDEETGDDSMVVKRRRVDKKWQELSAAEKNVYEGKAEHQTALRSQASGASFTEFVNEGFAGRFRRSSRQTAQRRAAMASLRDLQSSKAWSAGSATTSFGTGLHKSKVLEGSDEEMARLTKEIFAYDPEAKPTHRGTMQPVRSCSLQNYGLCAKDEELGMAKMLTFNFYAAMFKAGLHVKLPLLCQLAIADVSVYVWLAYVW